MTLGGNVEISQEAAKEFNTQLASVLMEMAATSDFGVRRAIIRREAARVFDSQFFPSVLQLTSVMADMNDRSEEVAGALLAAIVLETQDLLSQAEPDSLAPGAISLDLVVRLIAASFEDSPDRDDLAVLAEGVVRHKTRLADDAWAEQIVEELKKMAVACDARAQGDTKFHRDMAEAAVILRQLPRRILLMTRLLSLAELRDRVEVRRDIQREGVDTTDPREAALFIGALSTALEGCGAEDTVASESLLLALLEEGVGVDVGEVDRYLTQTGFMLSPIWDKEEEERSHLVSLGPGTVMPTVRRTVATLRSFGGGLGHWFAGQVAERGIQQVFQRAADLLGDLISSSPTEEPRMMGSVVAGILVGALEDSDADVRALAAAFCGLVGIPNDVVAGPLMGCVASDPDWTVKLTAAAALQGNSSVPSEIATSIADLLASQARNSGTSIPELLSKLEASDDQMAVAEIHAMVMISSLPELIASHGQDRPPSDP